MFKTLAEIMRKLANKLDPNKAETQGGGGPKPQK